jgi:hypothetical protein
MKARQAAIFAISIAATAAFGGGTATAATHGPASVRPYIFIGTEDGYGPTLAAATQAADEQMYGDYYGCQQPFYLVADGQLANGTWWAEVKANGCKGYI